MVEASMHPDVDEGASTSSQPRPRRVPRLLVPAIAAALMMLAPWIGVSGPNIRQLTLISIYTLVVIGINLSFGYAGELALGHVAMFATGAYVAGILAKEGWDATLTIPAAALAAAVVGLVSGIPGLRLGGWGLAMSSFFLVILIPDVVNLLADQTGGLIGLQSVPRAELFGHTLSDNQLYLLIVVCMVVVVGMIRNLVVSRHGSALLVLRQSPVLASALGINVYKLKILAYVTGAVPAGVAGALFIYLGRFIAPDFFSFDLAIAFIAASILGGSQSVYGAFLGAALLQLGPMRTTLFQEYALVAYGAFLVLGGVFFSGGAAGLAAKVGRSFIQRRAGGLTVQRERPPIELPPLDGQRLVVTDVTKEFGGARALYNVSLVAEPGQITGLIGPNGCGKTTLLNTVSGFYRPTSGTIALGDRQIDGIVPHRLSELGISRTFQTPLIPGSMTTLDVISVARYRRDYFGLWAAMLRLPRCRRARSDDHARSLELMQLLQIDHLADVQASSLPLGSRRLVEVARALASEPKLLLLDEPAAGLDDDELGQLVRAIQAIASAGATVILVEHNFNMVCDIADRVHVLDSGALIASGTPDQIRADAAVSRSYLGQTSPDAEAPETSA